MVAPVKDELEYRLEAQNALSEFQIDAACWQRLPEQFADCATLSKSTSLFERQQEEEAEARELEARRERQRMLVAYTQETARPPARAWSWLAPLPAVWNEDAQRAREDAFQQGLMHDLQRIDIARQADPLKFQCPTPASFGPIPEQEAVRRYAASSDRASQKEAPFNDLLAAAAQGNWMARVQVYNHLRKQADKSLAARHRALQVGEWLRQRRLGPVYSIFLRDLAESDDFNGPSGGVPPASIYAAMRGSYSTMDELGQKLKRAPDKGLQAVGARMSECARTEMPAFFFK
jgi:hypothetical protein